MNDNIKESIKNKITSLVDDYPPNKTTDKLCDLLKLTLSDNEKEMFEKFKTVLITDGIMYGSLVVLDIFKEHNIL